MNWRILLLTVPLLVALGARASEFRRVNRIGAPRVAAPKGAKAVAKVKPVSRELVVQAVKKVAGSWNTPAMREVLGDQLFDKSRFEDAMSTEVPRDAALKILSVQGFQTLNQYTRETPDGQALLISSVTVTVRTQIEFNDAKLGHQRIEGANELVLEITQQPGE